MSSEIFVPYDEYVETMKIQAVLSSYGDSYTGGDVWHSAQDWINQGFDAETADKWCSIGVWDAATAAVFRNAGLQPHQVAAAAKKLTRGLDDPAEYYTDADPIYAACNGDIDISQIIEAAE